MYLIVGLGNPKREYSGSRHNIGFQVIEALSRRIKAGAPVKKHRSLLAVAEYNGQQVMLAQPQTYMNRSGLAVCELMQTYRFDLSRLLVVYDELDLPPGLIRLRQQGGAAGHRGLQSIINALGTENFPRLRIGIGKPLSPVERANYVLQPPEGADREQIGPAIERAVDAVLVFISEGLEKAMNDFNRSLPAPD